MRGLGWVVGIAIVSTVATIAWWQMKPYVLRQTLVDFTTKYELCEALMAGDRPGATPESRFMQEDLLQIPEFRTLRAESRLTWQAKKTSPIEQCRIDIPYNLVWRYREIGKAVLAKFESKGTKK